MPAGFLIIHRSRAIELAGNGVGDVGELLPLLLEVLGGGSGSVLLQPVGNLLDGVENLEKLSAIAFERFRRNFGKLTVCLSSSSILPPRPFSSLTWFFRLKA